MLIIDVIVRTLAEPSRSESLFRALDSIQGQKYIQARPVIMVNGGRFNSAVIEALEKRSGIRLYRLNEASAGLACCEGRRQVTAPYFSYLDDDDLLIEDALVKPVNWLDDNPEFDGVINNGHFVKDNGARTELIHIASHVRIGQPALSLLDDSWLQPGAFVFRTERIPQGVFDPGWNHMEWTHLAYRLCAEHIHLHFMDIPTVLYRDTPGSMSKQLAHKEAELRLLKLIRSDSRMSAEVRRRASEKYRNTLHQLAMKSWQGGYASRAWRYHLASMQPPDTLKYLLFSRKLLWPGTLGSKRPIESA